MKAEHYQLIFSVLVLFLVMGMFFYLVLNVEYIKESPCEYCSKNYNKICIKIIGGSSRYGAIQSNIISLNYIINLSEDLSYNFFDKEKGGKEDG